MKTFFRLLLIPVLVTQISYTPKARAEWWDNLGTVAVAAGVGALTAVAVVALLNSDDEKAMNANISGSLGANISLGGDGGSWSNGNHNGSFTFEAQGHSADGQYSNCRRLVAKANEGNRPMDMSKYPSRVYCERTPGHWVYMQGNQFVVDRSMNDYYRPQPQPNYIAYNNVRPMPMPMPRPLPPPPQYVSYENGPYSPFYHNGLSRAGQLGNGRSNYVQPSYQDNNDFGLNLNLGAYISL